MPVRRLPVRPDLDQIKRQAKELLRALHAVDATAIAELREHHPDAIEPSRAKLADAQFVLARSYQAPSWTRLVHSVQLADAIWRDDFDAVRQLVTGNPSLIHEHVLIRTDSNWGPPMTYAANLGRDRIIRMLHELGATDLESAAGRAALQGQIATARMLYDMAGRPPIKDGALGGPAYTLNVEGTALLLSLGAPLRAGSGCPAETVLQTDARKPAAKHEILEMYLQHGLELPDTPTMALHCGRIDLLEQHLARDPRLLDRTFSHREIYPAELGCGDAIDAVSGTPLAGTTLLHMCVEFDEMEIARWLIARGADVNARAAVGLNGFGGFTPLFNTVVSQPNFWMNYRKRGPFVAPFTELLLEHGADPNVRASIWKQFGPGHDPTTTRHEYRDVTPLSWGRRFHERIFVSEPAMRLIVAAGGTE
ncbi:MAG TPA: ankyrin repeat domain-containing protein [Gemmatimonadaceae bacterium]|nr:ankyrin repeat domain-containing protein [Gemmatimonadaceae bacterium]